MRKLSVRDKGFPNKKISNRVGGEGETRRGGDAEMGRGGMNFLPWSLLPLVGRWEEGGMNFLPPARKITNRKIT
ncbi:MAG: hypothetical protein F6K58_07055 [Symploca sp. SIO2E9]|nr:hypothetical protein [Symploca sp. SIO2E9]